MKLLVWTPIIYSRKGFPRDEKQNPYIPGKIIKEAIESSLIYYYIKKDKEIENKVKTYLLKKGLDPEEVIEEIKNIIYKKYALIKDIHIPEKILLNQEEIVQEYAEVLDLRTWEDVESFKVEVYKGIVDLDLEEDFVKKFKSAGHSYCEALAKLEKNMLKEHPLAEKFYEKLLNELKKWEMPLRLGMWTEVKYKGNLLFFWRIKEVREHFQKEYRINITPEKVIYLPREKVTTGWCEIKVDL